MRKTVERRWLLTSIAKSLAVGFLYGCGRGRPGSNEPSAITVWAHHGPPAEWGALQDQIRRFNEGRTADRVELTEIAEATYATQVEAAAASGDLPDVLEFDSPLLANYVWKGYLRPLDGGLSDTIRSDLLPSIVEQGTYADRLYGVGTFDSGLGLYANLELLNGVGARYPAAHAAWSIEEFDDLLARLAARKRGATQNGAVLDLKRNYRGEWWTFGFYPLLVSAGADVIDRSDYQSADGTLNSPAAVAALRTVQRWVLSGYVDANTDGRAFVDRRVAFSWSGHWEYPRFRDALGDELAILPLPDFGHGTRTAMGSWAWGISRRCRNPDAAAKFIEFLMQPDEILRMTGANGAVPARRSAIERSELYRQGGALHLFAAQLETVAVPRPKTAAYPVITSVLQSAMLHILDGAPVKAELDRAVQAIDEDIRDNDGYPLLVHR